MKRSFVVSLAVLIVMSLAPIGRTDPATLALVRVQPRSQAEAAWLMTGFDETHNHAEGVIEILAWPGDMARLDAAGLDYEVVVADVVARDAALEAATPNTLIRMPGPDRTDYRILADYNSEMRTLAKKNPGLVKLLKLPHKSLEGRTVLGVEIAAGVKRKDGRPVMYIDGIHHAREWPAGEYPMIYAHHLVEKFSEERSMRSLLKRVRVIIVPVVNVDGFDYSRTSPVQNSNLGIVGLEGYWRKNRRSLTGATVPVAQKNPDAYGVDPNRNYSFHWGDNIGGSSGELVDQTYRGETPFSEPETRNIRHLFLSRPITGIVTNHTSGNLVLRPWGDTHNDAPDERILQPLGARVARAMGGYTNQKGIDLYATTGTTDDWTYGAVGTLGFTFEHGTSFHPPYGSEVGMKWKKVMRAFDIMSRAAAKSRWHGVIKGRVVDGRGRPLRNAHLVIKKSFKTPLWKGNPTGKTFIKENFSASLPVRRDGSFAWHVNPSTRPVVRKGTETYRFSVMIECNYGWVRELVVKRGQVLNLGRIRITATTDIGCRPDHHH
jgi:Zinc carboxypeptidase